MKKIILALAVLLIVFNLTACDPSRYYYDYDELKDNVVAVELISYNNPECKVLSEKRNKVIPFDFGKMEIIETLEAEQVEDFLQDFSKIQFLLYWKHSDSPNEACARIVFENGDFIVASSKVVYTGSFDSEGNVKEFIGGPSGRLTIKNLINKYFINQVE